MPDPCERGSVERPEDELRALARRVRGLRPDRQDPERFMVQREDIAHELVRLAARLDGR